MYTNPAIFSSQPLDILFLNPKALKTRRSANLMTVIQKRAIHIFQVF